MFNCRYVFKAFVLDRLVEAAVALKRTEQLLSVLSDFLFFPSGSCIFPVPSIMTSYSHVGSVREPLIDMHIKIEDKRKSKIWVCVGLVGDNTVLYS